MDGDGDDEERVQAYLASDANECFGEGFRLHLAWNLIENRNIGRN